MKKLILGLGLVLAAVLFASCAFNDDGGSTTKIYYEEPTPPTPTPTPTPSGPTITPYSIDATNYSSTAGVTTFDSGSKLSTAASSKTLAPYTYTQVIKFGGGKTSAYLKVKVADSQATVNVRVDGKSGSTGVSRSFVAEGSSAVNVVTNDANSNFTGTAQVQTDASGYITFYSADSSFQVWGIYITE